MNWHRALLGIMCSTLLCIVTTVKAQSVDSIDLQAMQKLQQTIEQQSKSHPEIPLEMALAQFPLKNQITNFSSIRQGKEHQGEFPRTKPAGVSTAEWNVLKNSKIPCESEGEWGGDVGFCNFSLIDVDQDNKRELIIESDMGGTGLWKYTSVMKQKGLRMEGGDSVLYSLNGRGGNQKAFWIQIEKRIYVAYVNGKYGEDQVYLMSPMQNWEFVPRITLDYRYQLSIPKNIPLDMVNLWKTPYPLPDSLYQALLKGLAQANDSVALSPDSLMQPLCPIPLGTSSEDSIGYWGFGAGHYSFEIVADFPVWVHQTCLVGRLADWFGGYDKKTGLGIQMWVRPPLGTEENTYLVEGRRHLIHIVSGIEKKFEGND